MTDEALEYQKVEEEQEEKETVEASIKNNELIFTLDSVEYKVRKPTFGNKQELFKAKAEKFTELIKDEKILFKEALKKSYLLKGIDIEDMERKGANLERKKDEIKEELGYKLTKGGSESELKELKSRIEIILSEQTRLASELGQHLEYTIEQQMFVFSYAYLIMLITYIKKEDKWVRLWSNYSEFLDSDEQFVNSIAYYAALIIKDEVKV